jgi:hypothetical protein
LDIEGYHDIGGLNEYTGHKQGFDKPGTEKPVTCKNVRRGNHEDYQKNGSCRHDYDGIKEIFPHIGFYKGTGVIIPGKCPGKGKLVGQKFGIGFKGRDNVPNDWIEDKEGAGKQQQP